MFGYRNNLLFLPCSDEHMDPAKQQLQEDDVHGRSVSPERLFKLATFLDN